MTTNGRKIEVLHPATGECVHVCHGPSPSGGCPLAGPDGVVPCAGFLIAPVGADPEYWPLPVPEGYRHCEVIWNERAQDGLRNAELARERWHAGLERENDRVRMLAAGRDPRYRGMTDRDLEKTALWRWRLTGEAQALRRSEEKNQRQADTYLAFVQFRRDAASPGPPPAERRCARYEDGGDLRFEQGPLAPVRRRPVGGRLDRSAVRDRTEVPGALAAGWATVDRDVEVTQ